MKKILFLGSKNKSDLVMYIALILRRIGYKTVIADATQKKTYLRSYTRYSDQDTLYNFFDVEIAPVNSLQNLKTLMKSSGDDLNNYDYMLVDIDHVHDKYDWEEFDASYYVADYEKVTLLDDMKLMETILANNSKEMMFNQVVYEVLSSIDNEYLDYLFNHKVNWSSIYKLPFDEMDVANKVDMQYNMKPTFKRLSKEFRNTLSSIITVLTGHHEKDTKLAMKQIEKGDI
ncbi:hypothetical protein [Metabacillus fastidiosus]|uniref:hypothetical protein n=1 Tax=Metabacillus fastidiosus TaxID=1458 RepID=UPI003D2A5C45